MDELINLVILYAKFWVLGEVASVVIATVFSIFIIIGVIYSFIKRR